MKKLIALILLAAAIALAASSCPKQAAREKPYGPEVTPGGGAGAPKTMEAVALGPGAPEVGKPMPDVQFTSLDGKVHKISEFKGKVVFVNFWGTWCPPCVKEMPDLISLYNENQAKGFQLVGIATKPDDLAALKAYNDKNHVPYLLAMGSDALMSQFGFGGVPTTLVIDKSGTVREMMIGKKDKAFFEGLLKKYI